jgi:hypothetical protein
MQEAIRAFHLKLRPDDQLWFEAAWKDFDGEKCMFNEALDLHEVLSFGKYVWGGQMLPDTIPILANGCGDYLCARFGFDGTLSEIIEWQHEGSNWRHYGYSICEALALNRWEYRLIEENNSENFPSPAGLSPVAAAEAACANALESKLKEACHRFGGNKLANMVGVEWKEFRLWLPDPSEMPVPVRNQLASIIGIDPQEMVMQDWDSAMRHAESTLQLRADLAWPYAVAGRALERSGFADMALKMYEAGVRKLCSSTSFTNTWKHTFTIGSKSAVDRLLAFPVDALDPSAREYMDAVTSNRLRQYWVAQSETAATQGRIETAYKCMYAAGWDDLYTNDILEILQALGLLAKRANSSTLQAILSLHISTVP